MLRLLAIASVIVVTTAGVFVSREQNQEVSRSSPSVGGGGTWPAANRQTSNNESRELVISIIDQQNSLLKAAKQLSKEFGIPISYEDPAWVGGSDLVRFTDTATARNFRPETLAKMNPSFRTVVPGSIEVRRTVRMDLDGYGMVGDILLDFLADHARRGNPGEFKIVRVGTDGYSIVPVQIRGEQNQWVSTSSPLYARISFPREKRGVGSTLALIARAVSEASGHEVYVPPTTGGLPGTGIEAGTVVMGATNEVARDVLSNTLKEMSLGEQTPKLAWNLEYVPYGNYTDAFSSKLNSPIYNLNIYIVTRKSANGENRIEYWPKSDGQKH